MPSRLARLCTRFSREEWNLGFVHQSAADIARHGLTQPVRWLDGTGPWRMLADPLCYMQADGSCVVLAEQLNHWIGRGEIWRAVIRPGSDPGRAVFRPWMRSNIHLSYPFTLRDAGNRLCMMVESWEAGGLHLWCEREEGLALVGPVIDRPVVDATPWRDQTGWWLFCTMQDDSPNERLHLFHADTLKGPWTPHPQNPVKVDAGSSRPAGPLFMADGQLIRPAQDCSRTYGGAVVLHEVTRLDHAGFQERVLRRLEPLAPYPDGLHTICPAGDWTIIDGKRWSFQPLDVPRKVAAGLQNRARLLRRGVLPNHLPLPHAAEDRGGKRGGVQ